MIQLYVNCWAVLIAAIANMALGFAWYGPLFGKQWVAMMGWTKADMEKGREKMQKDGWKTYLLAFAGSLMTSFVLAYVITFLGAYFYIGGIAMGMVTGFWMWVGFVVPVTLSTVLWEGKSWKLWFLNTSYYMFAFMIMGAIVSLWP